MGLAASQARFLGITARKSNIEYEGQQVNQQRTALAEEVNALYSKLLALDVPVAPDTTEFYETNYSFALTNTDGTDGEYLIKSFYQNDDGSYYLNTERTYSKNVAVGTVMNDVSFNETTERKKYIYTTENPDGYELYTSQDPAPMTNLINGTYGANTVNANDKGLYYYTDSTGQTHYLDKEAVDGYSASNPNRISSYVSSIGEFTETKIFEKATVTFDANNRMNSISVDGSNPMEVSTTRVYNSEGYDAALRDYTMSKDEYDKLVADLNAQTETLQQEDKVLELRLNQIDTEQNELQTELEAVKAVLDKNIESTFKTFA